jgi:hypothetical protein
LRKYQTLTYMLQLLTFLVMGVPSLMQTLQQAAMARRTLAMYHRCCCGI